jgi:hypothetical protein
MPASRNEKDKQQVAAFRKAARELGCDSDEGQFQDALRTIAKAKPSPEKDKRKASTDHRD